MRNVTTNMHFGAGTVGVDEGNNFTVALFYKSIVGKRINLRANCVANSNHITASLNLSFSKILCCFRTFIKQQITKIRIGRNKV